MVQTKMSSGFSTNLTTSYKKPLSKKSPVESTNSSPSYSSPTPRISKSQSLNEHKKPAMPEIVVENRKSSIYDVDYDFNENDEYEYNDSNDDRFQKPKITPPPKAGFFKKDNSSKRLSVYDFRGAETTISRRSSIRSNANNLNFRNDNSVLNRRTSIVNKESSIRNSLKNSFFELDTNNLSNRLKHHVTALLSYDAQITMLQVYEDMMVNELCKMNFDTDSLPRINISAKQSENLKSASNGDLDEKSQNQNEIMENKKIRMSYLVEIASKIMDLIESNRKRYFLNNRPELLGVSLFKNQNDSASMFSYYQTNSIDSVDLYDPLEVYSKWVSLCTNELKN